MRPPKIYGRQASNSRSVRSLTQIALLTCLLPWSTPSAFGDCINYQDYVHWVSEVETLGFAKKLVLDENYAYLADGSSFTIVDISSVSSPYIAASVDMPGIGSASDVALSQPFAYVAASVDGFQGFDVSDPLAPVLVGGVDTPGEAIGVVVRGPIAYVADGEAGLQIIDIDDPSVPQIVETVDTGWTMGIALQGNYLYVAAGYPHELLVFDVSKATLPQLIGSTTLPGAPSAFGVGDTLACIVTRSPGGIHFLDIADPASPVLLSSIPVGTGGGSFDVTFRGAIAYVASGYGGLVVVDVSSPASPQIVATFDTSRSPSQGASGVAVRDGFAYITNLNRSFLIVDVDPPVSPPSVGSVEMIGTPRRLAVAGDYAYVTTNNMLVVDISNPALPEVVGGIGTLGSFDDLALSGEYAYLVESGLFPRLRIVDVRDSPLLEHRGSIHLPEAAAGVVQQGAYAYVAAPASGLLVVDVTDPGAPALIADIESPGLAEDIAISGDFVYLADGANGLQVIDVSNPFSPQIVGDLDTPGHATRVTSFGDFAYLLDGIGFGARNTSLHVIDTSNHSLPDLVGSIGISGPANDIFLSGGIAYVAAGTWIHVIDVTNPMTPILLGTHDVPTQASSIVVHQGLMYAADASGRLLTLPLQCMSTSAILSMPMGSSVLRVMPNPFLEHTTLGMTMGAREIARLTVFDIAGRVTRSLLHEPLTAGFHTASWDGRDDAGLRVAGGTYFVRLEVGDKSHTKKVVYLGGK